MLFQFEPGDLGIDSCLIGEGPQANVFARRRASGSDGQFIDCGRIGPLQSLILRPQTVAFGALHTFSFSQSERPTVNAATWDCWPAESAARSATRDQSSTVGLSRA